MIVYITGASGSGKTTLMRKIPLPAYDMDDIYERNWKLHRKIETVQRGVKHDTDTLIAKHKVIVFVGLQAKEQLPFTPDIVFVLHRTDYERFYRDKLARDLNLLCKYKADFEDVFRKAPFEDFRNHFWSNDVVNMKPFDEFKKSVVRMNKSLVKSFEGVGKAKLATAEEILAAVKRLS